VKIEFNTHDKHVLKHFPIKPAKDFLPKWYKGLPADLDSVPTIAKCMPVRDMVTAGYIMPMPFEQKCQVEIDMFGKETVERDYPVELPGQFSAKVNLMTHPWTGHSHEQCPVSMDGVKKNYFKLQVPWQIVTPKGYSCLFIQPFYHFQDNFTVLPAIIDTDTSDMINQNLPCVHKKDQFDILPGDPVVQIIPFKRDEWTSEHKLIEKDFSSKMNFFLHNMYKRAFHQKKSFK